MKPHEKISKVLNGYWYGMKFNNNPTRIVIYSNKKHNQVILYAPLIDVGYVITVNMDDMEDKKKYTKKVTVVSEINNGLDTMEFHYYETNDEYVVWDLLSNAILNHRVSVIHNNEGFMKLIPKRKGYSRLVRFDSKFKDRMNVNNYPMEDTDVAVTIHLESKTTDEVKDFIGACATFINLNADRANIQYSSYMAFGMNCAAHVSRVIVYLEDELDAAGLQYDKTVHTEFIYHMLAMNKIIPVDATEDDYDIGF